MYSASRVPFLLLVSSIVSFGSEWARESGLALNEFQLGHLQSAAQHWSDALKQAEASGLNGVELDKLLTAAVPTFQALGRYAEAEAMLDRALVIRRAELGDLEVALGLNNLGAIYQEETKYAEAQRVETEALALAQKILPPKDPRLIPFFTHNAALARSLGDHVKGERLLRDALAIADRTPDLDPLVKARLYRHLGAAYGSLGKTDQAEAADRHSIELYQSSAGYNLPELGAVQNHLGELLLNRNDVFGAIDPLAKAAEICKKTGAGKTRNCLANQINLSSAQIDLDSFAEAEHSLTRVIDALENVPSNGYLLAAALNNRGKAAQMQGKFKPAEADLERSARLWENGGSAMREEYAKSLSNLAGLYVREHKFDKAGALYSRAIEIDRSIPGQGGLRFAADLDRLARLRTAQRRYAEAEPMLLEAIAIQSAGPYQSTPFASEALFDLGALCYLRNKPADASDYYRRGIDLVTAAGQRRLPRMAVILDSYSQVLRTMNDFAGAEKFATEALGIRVRQTIHPMSLP